jgi:hypothetical protein
VTAKSASIRLERQIASVRRDRDIAARAAGKLCAERSEMHEALRPLAELWVRAQAGAASGRDLKTMRQGLELEHFQRAFELVDLDSPKPRVIVL